MYGMIPHINEHNNSIPHVMFSAMVSLFRHAHDMVGITAHCKAKQTASPEKKPCNILPTDVLIPLPQFAREEHFNELPNYEDFVIILVIRIKIWYGYRRVASEFRASPGFRSELRDK
jgi:hypothetical protein